MITSSPSNDNKRVHFSQNLQIFEIESLASYTRKEIRTSWHTASKIQKRLDKKIDAALEWEASGQNSKFCIRGLEHYTRRGEIHLQRIIGQCVSAVLNEQDRAEQLCATSVDTTIRLKAVSQPISMFSAELALIRARKDETEAKRIYQKLIKEKDKKAIKDRPRKTLSVEKSKTSVAPTGLRHPLSCSSSSRYDDELDAVKRKLERICYYRNTILS